MTELEALLRNEFAITQMMLLTILVTLFYIAFIKRNK